MEAAIYDHPAVYEAAVFGIPHPRLGEELVAAVLVKPGHSLDEADLQAHVRERLAGFKVPSRVVFVDTQLPRGATGKILKRELRDSLAGGPLVTPTALDPAGRASPSGSSSRARPSGRSRRTVLVTGANSGIGLATVIEAARRGYHAVGTVRSKAKAKQVREAAAGADVEVDTLQLDVTDAEGCQRTMAGLQLYGLVNNAGYALTGAIEDITDDEARALFETMVFAPMRLARLALPGMRAGGGGRIVNVSSIAGLVSSPLAGWYTGAKHALEGLTDALRIEVARDGVAVCLVEPGGFRTGIWAEMTADIERHRQAGSRLTTAYERSRRLQQLIEPVMGSPEQCAKVIVGALDARLPRPRYLVGLDAQAIRLGNRLTPDMVQDRVLRLVLGL